MEIYIVLINNAEFGYVDCCPFYKYEDALMLFNELKSMCIDNEEDIEHEEYDENDPETLAFFSTYNNDYQVVIRRCTVE